MADEDAATIIRQQELSGDQGLADRRVGLGKWVYAEHPHANCLVARGQDATGPQHRGCGPNTRQCLHLHSQFLRVGQQILPFQADLVLVVGLFAHLQMAGLQADTVLQRAGYFALNQATQGDEQSHSQRHRDQRQD